MQEVLENTPEPIETIENVETANNAEQTKQREIKKIKSIDFNCDLAQSFGVYKNDEEFNLLDYVSSVNISTGFHAGDPIAIKNALLQAKEKNVVIGAHIGFDDIQGFGNRAMMLSEDEVEALVVYQIGAIMSFAKAYGMEIEHVRPHGAMYQIASENFAFSCAIAKSIKKCSNWLTYYGASGDVLAEVGEQVKLPIAHEIKLYKIYNQDGSVDYTAQDVVNVEFSMRRLQGLLRTSQINNNMRGLTAVNAETIHFSTSQPISLEVAKRANELIQPIPVNYNKVQDSGWV